MKKYSVLILAAILAVGFTASAQQPMNSNGCKMQNNVSGNCQMPAMISPEKRAEKMAKDLTLTDVQKNQLTTFFEKQDAKHKAQMAEMKKAREEFKAKMEKQRKETENELKGIIGEEKFQQLQQLRQQRMEKMQMMRKRMMHNRMKRFHNKMLNDSIPPMSHPGAQPQPMPL